MIIHRKQLLTILLILLSFAGIAQNKLVTGRVADATTNEPLEFVTIFITNTTMGTTTDEKGSFSISLPPGRYEMVVSMVGYGPIVHPIEVTPEKSPQAILFKLTQTETALNSVSVKAKRDPSWYDNLELFKTNFLGRSEVASQCKLTNPENLIIVFDPVNGTLKVESKDLMVIENPVLGYKVSYLLVEFNYDLNQKYVSYLGYPRFEPLKGSKAKQKRWEKNRLKAYNGSAMHFVRTLRQQKLEEEGYNLRRLIRIPNPDRPSEEEFAEARRQLYALGNSTTLTENHPLNKILAKTSLPKILEKLDTTRVSYSEYISERGDDVSLSFDGYFQIVYTGEKEEPAYVAASSPFRKRQPTYQTSVVSMKEKQVLLETSGSISDPLALVFEDYWGWEKVGDMLPLDYEPGKE
ncbi:carboxypeptidase-like regulatory domain-containing protein [Dyadobacter sp. CY312]|uniref:carboxypeptidase-like regulatory domain-containing protein n=1 Tax=Dyadobacter sp. CY312 TaxID=2907303 RepID=UPI001F2AB522|nr:carboxypeptidase-like regulatory domain-containing protein [Dyadobacter sp. CY312]MCE7044318.1 carboxypeptidase-like regulatory domain-containing protein [Dyadobacter sp. CY312]